MLEKLLVLEVTQSIIRFKLTIHKMINRNAVRHIAQLVPRLSDRTNNSVRFDTPVIHDFRDYPNVSCCEIALQCEQLVLIKQA